MTMKNRLSMLCKQCRTRFRLSVVRTLTCTECHEEFVSTSGYLTMYCPECSESKHVCCVCGCDLTEEVKNG